MDDEEQFWGKPLNARVWHIFEDGRCICSGGWMLLSTDESVSGDENYREGEDCKQCCRKAGILEE